MAANEMMRAAVLVREGDATDAIVVRDVPVPEPAADEVRVRVSHAALNHLDIWIRRGLPSVPKPRIMGADAAGWLDTPYPGSVDARMAANLAVGDRVLIDPGASCGSCPRCLAGDTALCRHFRVLGEHVDGTLAEYVVVPASAVHPVPEHLDMEHAAALTLTFATAWRMLFTRAGAQPGERALVWGASSGVGTAAIQLCASSGIATLATTRSDAKVDALRALGADHVVVSGTGHDAADRVLAAVAQAFGPDALDVAFDHLGAAAWEPSMRALARGGRYVTCGATTGAGPPAQITRLFWKQLSMLGSTMASRADVADMLAFVRTHGIAPLIDTSWPLADIHAAHHHLEAGAQTGKVVISIARDAN